MKKFFIILSILLIINTVFAQKKYDTFDSCTNLIIKKLKKKEFYEAIRLSDTLISDYSEDYSLYYNRGIARINLNDYESGIKDLKKAKELGSKFRKSYVNFMTSNNYVVSLISKNYKDDTELTAENNYKPIYGLKDSLQGALRPERTCFDVYYYNLTVKILPKSKSITGNNKIYFKTIEKTDRIQIDLSDNFDINSINWNGKELKYTRIYNAIFITFDESLKANENYQITIDYSGVPREAPHPPWNGGFTWKKKRHNDWVGVSCEHLGASSWWPCKDHLSEKPDSMTINVQVPSKYQGISNGNLRSSYPIDNKYTNYEWFVSYPINSYGVTFYMGKFVNFNEVYNNANGSYNIDYYVLPHNLDRAKEYYSQTKDIIRVYEKLYGEYPYKNDGIAMIEAPYMGMEHQSAIAIGDGYGRKKRRSYENTDYDYLVVHELAHEWWGNTVTMSDMADAWISEGFATYSELLFMEELYGYEEYISATAVQMKYIFNIWPMVGIKDVNDNSFFGGDIYNKGASMLNNFRCIINDDSVFFSLIKDFYTEYKFKTIATDDFIEFANDYLGYDNSDFFNKFLYDTEPPILQYDFTYENNILIFNYKWINVGEDFTMPFSITFNNSYNHRMVGTTTSTSMKFENVSSFYLPNEKRFDKEIISKNAFTYFWTSWIQ
ncbi:MAG: M1 family metallopeptidase [Bacteroidota bacterium]